MLFSTLFFFISIFAGLTANSAQLVNLGGEFDAFVAASQGKDAVGIEAEWAKFETNHQSIYDEAVYRKSDPGWEQRLRLKRDRFFVDFRTLAPKMDLLFAQAPELVSRQEAHFRTVFPDLSPDIPVIFMPSLRSFNGQVRDLDEFGRPGLLLGVDFIIERGDNLDILFSHEFFHVYHEGHLKPGSTGQSMATPLWKEGLAVYVSGVLNPGQDDANLLMDPDLAKTCQDPVSVAGMASAFLSVLKTDGAVTYPDWFMLNGTTQPTRRGYCLGLQVIRRIVGKIPITELVTWDESHFSQEIEATLNGMIGLKVVVSH